MECSESAVVSEGGLGAPNVIFKGQLADGKSVAIKKFPRREWKDAEAFIVSVELVYFAPAQAQPLK